MDWIAQNWWLWLSGLLVVLAVVAIRSIRGLFGLAKDTADLAGKLHHTTKLPPEDRRRHLTNVGLDVVGNKIKQRIERLIVNGGLLLVGGVFGALLVIALVRKFTA